MILSLRVANITYSGQWQCWTINSVLIQVYPRNRGWSDLFHSNSYPSNSHSPSRSIQGILLLQTNTLALLLHLRLPCLLYLSSLPLMPFTSNSLKAFLKTCPSSHLNTCLYHLTPFAFAIWTTVSFNPNISIRSSNKDRRYLMKYDLLIKMVFNQYFFGWYK